VKTGAAVIFTKISPNAGLFAASDDDTLTIYNSGTQNPIN
jgi:hypothetical protein